MLQCTWNTALSDVCGNFTVTTLPLCDVELSCTSTGRYLLILMVLVWPELDWALLLALAMSNDLLCSSDTFVAAFKRFFMSVGFGRKVIKHCGYNTGTNSIPGDSVLIHSFINFS